MKWIVFAMMLVGCGGNDPSQPTPLDKTIEEDAGSDVETDSALPEPFDTGTDTLGCSNQETCNQLPQPGWRYQPPTTNRPSGGNPHQ